MRSLVLLSVLACRDEPSDPQADTPEVAPSYAERGPWFAGTRQETITGTDGLQIPVQIWYPSTEDASAPVVYDGLLAGDAYIGVPADCETARPLVAFSHGYAGIRYQSPFFTEFLASHGYVVIAPDHVGNTFADVVTDFDALLLRRPTDVRDAVDFLMAQSSDASSPYAGCVDPDAGYAVSGHSFGGWTALALAGASVNDPAGGVVSLADDRVWAVLAFAPWDALGAITDGTKDISVPAMILTGTRDETTPIAQVEGLWSPMTVTPRLFGEFPNAGHYSFSPVACLLFSGDGCGDTYIDEPTFTSLVDTASGAFLGDARGLSGAAEQIPVDVFGVDWSIFW